MLISFQNMDEVAVPHCRGGEKELFRKHVDTGENQIMLARLEPGASVGIHTHVDDSETIYYLSGPHPRHLQRRRRGPGVLCRYPQTVR